MQERHRQIDKTDTGAKNPPNLPNYDRARAEFSGERARREFDGPPGGRLNTAHEAVDRHAAGPPADCCRTRRSSGPCPETTLAPSSGARSRASPPNWTSRRSTRQPAFAIGAISIPSTSRTSSSQFTADTGVDVPEADYTKLASIDDCVEYPFRALGEHG